MSLPQCVSENGAAALGLDFNGLLVSNKTEWTRSQSIDWPREPFWVSVMVGHGLCTLTGTLQFFPTPSPLCLLLWLWDPHPPASPHGAGAASALSTCPFAAVMKAQDITIFLLFLFITAGVKGSWG